MHQPWLTRSDWEQQDFHLKKHQTARFQRPSLPLDLTAGIHSLLGPRRVGKTTQFKLWCLTALKSHRPSEVAYLDAERFETWKDLLPRLEEPLHQGLKVFFIDEVTVVKDWTRAFKVVADQGLLENACVWLTGSNAFDLKNVGERLPGRRGRNHQLQDVELLPLSFKDFYDATHKRFSELDERAIFEKYCVWGGYPMAISECLERDLPSYDLMQELLDVVLGETSRKHRSPRLSAALAERLWQQLGGRTSYHALSKFIDAGSHPIIRQYIEILQGSYTLIEVGRLNPKTGMSILRKEKKYYFLDPLVMGALVSFAQSGSPQPAWLKEAWASQAKQGHWIENMVASDLRKRGLTLFYDEQNGGEIDFVFKDPNHSDRWKAIEVKRSAPDPSELRPLQAYPGGETWVLEPFEPKTGVPMRSLTERLKAEITRAITNPGSPTL